MSRPVLMRFFHNHILRSRNRAQTYLVNLHKNKNAHDVGAKGVNLCWLIRKGLTVPVTYAVTFGFQEQYRRSERLSVEALGEELGRCINLERSYAVRSSANLEDDPRHSFAGQFKTFLNIHGIAELLRAVQEVLENDRAPGVQAYIDEFGINNYAVKMAVLLQEMVQPCVSGVAFSRNPLTGLDEIVVEAVQGSGEALVKAGITPGRWVYKWGEWITRPESTAIDPQLIHQVAIQTGEIARLYDAPVDLEWVYNGRELYWLQLRPITRLEEIHVYSNRISREVFPGLIKPLVWSVNIPLVNNGWIELFSELIGPNSLQPEHLAKSFAHRAYFNMGTIGRIFDMLGMPKDALELLMGMQGGAEKPRFRPTRKTFQHLPRMFAFLVRKLRFGPQVLPGLEAIRKKIADLGIERVGEMQDKALLREIDRLYELARGVASLNIIVPLLMMTYNALLKRQLARVGVDFATFDLTRSMAELHDYVPNIHLKRLAEQIRGLDPATRARMRVGTFENITGLPGLGEFHAEFTAFLNRFGHLSESGNDFSVVPWRENPDLVLQIILDESERLETERDWDASIAHPEAKKTTWADLKIGPARRLAMGPVYRRARQFRLYREAVSSTYTYTYGLLRIYFLELGRRMAGRGLLESSENIFFLEWEEVRQLIDQAGGREMLLAGQHPARLTQQRKNDMLADRDRILPDTIYGDELPPPVDPDWRGATMQGIPTSRGYYRGPARVIRGQAEFDRLAAGDVLVIPYSDVGWTPLFTRAGAVIAEAGGMLSHSSIVARELNLPCVVSVDGACGIPDDTLVAVDGYSGEIAIL